LEHGTSGPLLNRLMSKNLRIVEVGYFDLNHPCKKNASARAAAMMLAQMIILRISHIILSVLRIRLIFFGKLFKQEGIEYRYIQGFSLKK
jgi:hypothetical protein